MSCSPFNKTGLACALGLRTKDPFVIANTIGRNASPPLNKEDFARAWLDRFWDKRLPPGTVLTPDELRRRREKREAILAEGRSVFDSYRDGLLGKSFGAGRAGYELSLDDCACLTR